MQVIPETRRVY